MTIHSAKGLEFPVVFIVGMEENIFPSPMSANNPRELEEERRLLYVAITRAEKYCILTCAKNRWRFGKLEFGAPSRFLHDIDPSFLRIENDNLTDVIQDTYFVTYLEGEGENQKATVTFKNTGQKVLLLKFARYTIIE